MVASRNRRKVWYTLLTALGVFLVYAISERFCHDVEKIWWRWRLIAEVCFPVIENKKEQDPVNIIVIIPVIMVRIVLQQ